MAENAGIMRASDLLVELEDIHRPNHFEVVIKRSYNETIKINHIEARSNTTTFIPYVIKTIQMPSTIFGDITIKRMGRSFKMPGAIDFQNVAITMYDDIKSKAREYFTNWMQGYYGVDVDGGVFGGIKEFIDNTIEIKQLNRSWNPISTTTLYNVFPKMVGELSLSHDTADTLSEFSVVVAYSHAQYEKVEYD